MVSLNGKQLRIVTRWDNTYRYDVDVKKVNDTVLQLNGGYAVYILQDLAELLNFSYVLCPEVGTFNFTKAEEHRIDIFVGSFSLFEARAKIVDPTFVIGSSKVVALINHDFETGMEYNLLQPFQPLLWYSVLIFVVLILCAFLLIGVVEAMNIGDTVFHGIALLLQKCTNLEFQKYQTQIIIWVTTIATLILMTCYSGSMVSLLTVKHFQINTLEDLLDSSYDILLERGFNNGSAIQSIAETLNDMPIMKKLLFKAETSEFVYESFEKSIDKVKLTPSAYVIDEETAFVTVIQSSMGQLPCSWNTISVAGIKYPWSMFVPKKWPFKPDINSGLLRLDQHGLLIRARRHWIPRPGRCFSSSSNNDGVPFYQLHSVYLIYGMGAVTAFVLLAIYENRYFFGGLTTNYKAIYGLIENCV